MKIFGNTRSNAVRILVLLMCIVLLAYAVVALVAYKINQNNKEVSAVSLESSVCAVNDIAAETNDTDTDVSAAAEIAEDFDIIADADMEDATDYFSIVNETIEKVRAADVETIEGLFGKSDVFTPELVADRVQATQIQEVNTVFNEDETVDVIIHVCTIDYIAMNNDYLTLEESEKLDYIDKVGEITDGDTTYIDTAKYKLAENFTDGKYNVCYNVPVTIENMEVRPTEAFKMAITGGWYTGIGIELTNTPCDK